MRRTLTLLMLCTALGACSSGGSTKAVQSTSPTTTQAAGASTTAPTKAPGTTTPGTTSPGTTSPGTTTATPSGAVAPCKVVTTDDVKAAFGGTVAAGVVNPDNGGCDYVITGTTKTGPSGVLTQVSIEFTSDYQTYDHSKVVFPDIVKVPGLGTEAWYYSFGNQLHINLGGSELVISGMLPGDKTAIQTEVIAFGHVVTSKL